MDNLSKKFKLEEERIRWRQEVMSMPGGVEWLLNLARKYKFKEQSLGPWLGYPTKD